MVRQEEESNCHGTGWSENTHLGLNFCTNLNDFSVPSPCSVSFQVPDGGDVNGDIKLLDFHDLDGNYQDLYVDNVATNPGFGLDFQHGVTIGSSTTVPGKDMKVNKQFVDSFSNFESLSLIQDGLIESSGKNLQSENACIEIPSKMGLFSENQNFESMGVNECQFFVNQSTESTESMDPYDCAIKGFGPLTKYVPVLVDSDLPMFAGGFKPYFLGGLPIQWNLEAWEHELKYENDIDLRNYLSKGVLNGFDIVDNVDIAPYHQKNYSSATKGDAKKYIDNLFQTEISEYKLLRTDKKPTCIHSIGAVPKQGGKFRPVTDCSEPSQFSINSYMSSTFREFSYHSVDHVTELIQPGMFMASVDIADAYRTVSVSPDQWKYQGLEWTLNGKTNYYCDTRLCFGIRCAPFIFTEISNFVVRCLNRRGYFTVINYLDDFWVGGRTFDECCKIQNVLISLLISLGFRVNFSKCIGPTQCIRYLGVLFDSNRMSVLLPEDKINKLLSEISFFQDKTRATRRQIQRLCGILAHCSKVVRAGRTFSRRIIDLLKSLPVKGNPRIKLTEEFRKDVSWWSRFVRVFNGKATIIKYNFGQGPIFITDSSKSGYGLYSGEDWQCGFFNTDTAPIWELATDPYHNHWININFDSDVNINVLELVPVWQAVRRYSGIWRDLHVLCLSDNTQVVSMINKGISVNHVAMEMLREIFMICAMGNIYITARHIGTNDNKICDYLSRLKMESNPSDFPMFLCCSNSIAEASKNDPAGIG